MRFRLRTLLLLPIAAAALHLGLEGCRTGGTYREHVCLDCGARQTSTMRYAFAMIPLGEGHLIRSTVCSEFLRSACSFECARHRWELACAVRVSGG